MQLFISFGLHARRKWSLTIWQMVLQVEWETGRMPFLPMASSAQKEYSVHCSYLCFWPLFSGWSYLSFEITSADANLERLQGCSEGVFGGVSLKGKPETSATVLDSLNLAYH